MWEKHGLGIVPYMYALLTLEWHFRNVIWRAIAQPGFLYKERVFTAGIGTCGTERT
jgi:hypothetical protein